MPIYINLKALRRDVGVTVDRELIRSHVIKSVNRINDRFVDEFITANFDAGVKDGTWFFLFDSFDEVPDVLSSIEADATVAEYTQAIADFLGGMNACRAVVASRFYRGPEAQGWRKFRILDLSAQRQRQLIGKALLVRSTQVTEFVGDLQNASPDVRNMASNPLLLGLLCEHVRLGHQFPANAFDVYSKYIASRLNRDALRVTERYAISVDEVREVAEEIAYAITADRQIGLTPRRSELWAAIQRQRFRRYHARVVKALDALEYMRLGKQDVSDGTSDPQFTFAHRRFQEFFATSIVARDTTRVPPRVLLLDARWRETAVVICQIGRTFEVAPLLDEISSFLIEAAASSEVVDRPGKGKFAWKAGVIHVLGIVQDGYSARMGSLPGPIRELTGKIVGEGFHRGDFLDKKFALEVAGPAPEQVLIDLLRSSLALDSQVINDVIYRQVARLAAPPPDLMVALRTALLRITFERQSAGSRDSIRAFVRRVPQSPELAGAARLAFWIAPVALILAAIAVVPLSLALPPLEVTLILTLFTGLTGFYVKKYFVWDITILEFGRFYVAVITLLFSLVSILSRAREALPHTVQGKPLPTSFPHFALTESVLYRTVLHTPRMELFAVSSFTVLASYALLWPIGSIRSVRLGIFLRPSSWPLTPLSSIAAVFTSISSRKSWMFGIIGAICCLFLIEILVVYPVLATVFTVFGTLVSLWPVSAYARGCVRLSLDTWRVQRWFKQKGQNIPGDALSSVYHRCRTKRGRAALLERSQGLGVVKTAASADRLRHLALHIDGRLAGEPMVQHRATVRSPLSRVWQRVAAAADAFDWTLKESYLHSQRDSVYLMLESNRRAALTEDPSAAHVGVVVTAKVSPIS